jgi:hypothetical protein
MDNITPVELPELPGWVLNAAKPHIVTGMQAYARAAVMDDRARLGSAVAVPEAHDELGRDLDGEISLDWQNKAGDMLSMSLSKDGRLAWAVHRAGPNGSGKAQLNEHAYWLLNDVLDECAATPPAAKVGTSSASAEVSTPPSEVWLSPSSSTGEWHNVHLRDGPGPHGFMNPASPTVMAHRYVLATLSSPAKKVGTEDADAQETPGKRGFAFNEERRTAPQPPEAMAPVKVETEAVIDLMHRAGFAGSSWTLGVEEMARVLALTTPAGKAAKGEQS